MLELVVKVAVAMVEVSKEQVTVVKTEKGVRAVLVGGMVNIHLLCRRVCQ
tara:strand:- start:373 stop:522 length:150 start_codon:yes stop_codon:yes gene_type:complete